MFGEDWENPREDAQWRDDPGPSPFKARTIHLHAVPGLASRFSVLLDFVHIYHLGYGQDIAASSVCLLAELCHYTNDRAFDKRLDFGFQLFDAWCHSESRTSAIDEFSKDAFKMKKILGRTTSYCLEKLFTLRHLQSKPFCPGMVSPLRLEEPMTLDCCSRGFNRI